jgi:small subunit ribosomal protein S7
MARRRRAEERKNTPDPKFHNLLVAKFTNFMMQDGKKGVSERILYQALEMVQERTSQDGLEMFKKAVANVTPTLEVKSRRVGGATYQVPMEIRPKRKTGLAIRWIIAAATARNEKSMEEKLASELVAASNNDGAAIKKKDDTHKMAEANKAFAHFRW